MFHDVPILSVVSILERALKNTGKQTILVCEGCNSRSLGTVTRVLRRFGKYLNTASLVPMLFQRAAGCQLFFAQPF